VLEKLEAQEAQLETLTDEIVTVRKALGLKNSQEAIMGAFHALKTYRDRYGAEDDERCVHQKNAAG
jgi:hypothetical protein